MSSAWRGASAAAPHPAACSCACAPTVRNEPRIGRLPFRFSKIGPPVFRNGPFSRDLSAMNTGKREQAGEALRAAAKAYSDGAAALQAHAEAKQHPNPSSFE